jgi:hypothetical protein
LRQPVAAQRDRSLALSALDRPSGIRHKSSWSAASCL